MTKRARLLVVASLPFLILAGLRASEGAGLPTDDQGQYLMHAEAVAEGRAYTDIAYIYNPYAPYIGPRAEPPGLPLTLAAVFFLFGQNMVIVKLVLLALAVCYVVLAGLYFTVHSKLELGLGVALLCALAPTIVHSSTQVLTDIPFCALIWAVICLVDAPGPWRIKRIVGVTLLGAVAVAFRPAGIALVPALIAYSLVRFREHRWRPAVPAAVLLLTGIILLSALSLSTTGLGSEVSLHDLFRYTSKNWNPFRFAVFDSHLYPFPWDLPNDAYHVASVPVMLVGVAAWFRSDYKRFATLFAAVYLAMFVVLPAQTRYFWPIYPLFVFGLLNGVRILTNITWRGVSSTKAARVAILLGAVVGLMSVVRGASAEHMVDMADLPDARDLFTHLRRQAAERPIRVMFSKPRVMAWETGIPTMGPSDMTRNIIAELNQGCITHLITHGLQLDEGADRAVREAVEATPAAFAVEFENDTFRVHRYMWAECKVASDSG